MKAILEFNLPEEQKEFEIASNGSKWLIAMWDLDQHLRANTKYAPDDMHEEAYKAYEEVREKLREIMNDSGLNFE